MKIFFDVCACTHAETHQRFSSFSDKNAVMGVVGLTLHIVHGPGRTRDDDEFPDFSCERGVLYYDVLREKN